MLLIGNQVNGDEKLLIVRYNPDDFYVDNVKVKISQENKMSRLFDVIKSYEVRNEKIDILYMFYDTYDNYPTIIQDKDYNKTLAQLVVPSLK